MEGLGLARRPRLEGTSNRKCIYEKSSSLPGSFTGGEGNELPTKGRMLSPLQLDDDSAIALQLSYERSTAKRLRSAREQ